MNLLAFVVIVAVVVWLLVWAADSIPMKPPSLNIVVRVAIILIGVLLIARRAGWL